MILDIKDMRNYEPKLSTDEQLRDDFRLLLAHYANKKRGKKTKWKISEILLALKKTLKEFKRRGLKIHPENMTELSREAIAKVMKKAKLKDSIVIGISTEDLLPKLEEEFGEPQASEIQATSEPTFESGLLFTAPIYSTRTEKEKEGESITIETFNEAWSKPMMLVKDFVTLVGGVCNFPETGTEGDADVLLRLPRDCHLVLPVTFRLYRAVRDPEVRERLHFLFEDNFGPFTNHKTMYDLWLIPSKSKEIFLMSRDPNFRKAQELSMKENKITMFQPFYQQKPQHGRDVGTSYTLDGLIDVLNRTWKDWKEHKVYVSKKYDGVTCQFFKDTKRAEVWTEDGGKITDNLPSVIEQLKAIKGHLVGIGELEWYHGTQHMPRADTAGVINHLDKERESEIRLTIYDLFYRDGGRGEIADIHMKPYGLRRSIYLKIPESKNIKVSNPEILCSTEEKLRKAVEETSSIKGSEGSMLKLASEPYYLTIHPTKPSMIKFKKERQVIARVIAKHKIEGANAWIYDMAVDESVYIEQ